MANTRTKKDDTPTNPEVVNDTVEIKKPQPKAAAKPETPIIPKDIDPDDYVVVRNGTHGRLIYKSKRTGEKFVWDDFGSEQELQLRELKNAKSSAKKFFMKNWFMFDEDWIVDYLGVSQYYKNAIALDQFDDTLRKPAAELKKIVPKLSSGQKKTLAYRASDLIRSGELDSRKTILTLEELLGVELIEK